MNFYEFPNGIVINLDQAIEVEGITRGPSVSGGTFSFSIRMTGNQRYYFSDSSFAVVDGWRNDVLDIVLPKDVNVTYDT